jgi:hypothetical protein
MIEVVSLLELGVWRLLVDIPATRRLHEGNALGAAERCGCPSCRNFIVCRQRFPLGVPELFASLGIDWTKEAHVAHGTCLRDDEIPYAGFFRMVGEIQRGGDLFVKQMVLGQETSVPRQEALVRMPPSDFRFGFSGTAGVTVPGEMALHFRVTFPWLLAGNGFRTYAMDHARTDHTPAAGRTT